MKENELIVKSPIAAFNALFGEAGGIPRNKLVLIAAPAGNGRSMMVNNLATWVTTPERELCEAEAPEAVNLVLGDSPLGAIRHLTAITGCDPSVEVLGWLAVERQFLNRKLIPYLETLDNFAAAVTHNAGNGIRPRISIVDYQTAERQDLLTALQGGPAHTMVVMGSLTRDGVKKIAEKGTAAVGTTDIIQFQLEQAADYVLVQHIVRRDEERLLEVRLVKRDGEILSENGPSVLMKIDFSGKLCAL